MRLYRIGIALMLLLSSLQVMPAQGFDPSGFLGKTTQACIEHPTACKAGVGTAAAMTAAYCRKHKIKCALAGAVVVGVGVVAGSEVIDKAKEAFRCLKGDCSKDQFVAELRAALGLGLDACDHFARCREIYEQADDYKQAHAQVREFLAGIGVVEPDVNDQGGCHWNVYMFEAQAPEAVVHIMDAQLSGYPKILTLGNKSSPETRARRNAATGPHKRAYSGSTAGLQWDEYPMASTVEGGAGASVRLISANDNQQGGIMYTSQTAALPAGCRLTIVPVPSEGGAR